MPQLMPLYWLVSMFIFIVLFMVMLDLFMNFNLIILNMFKVVKFDGSVEWLW